MSKHQYLHLYHLRIEWRWIIPRHPWLNLFLAYRILSDLEGTDYVGNKNIGKPTEFHGYIDFLFIDSKSAYNVILEMPALR